GVPRVGAAFGVGHPGHVTALLVDGDDRLARRRRAEGGAESGRVADDVGAEERDAGQPPLERPEDPGRRGGAGEGRDEDGVGERGEGRVDARLGGRHPFTAPATRPLASRRWVTRKNARTGMVKRVEDAMIAPQLVEFWP